MSSSGPSHFTYRSLLSPKDCGLIIVDCAAMSRSGPRQRSDNRRWADAVRILCSAASDLAIPVLAFVQDPSRKDYVASLLPTESHVLVSSGDAINPWDSEELASAAIDTGRSRLVIAGQCAELSVTFAALSALERGYDVFLVEDVTVGSDPDSKSIAVSRMLQAGVVPVTVKQIVAEWRRGANS